MFNSHYINIFPESHYKKYICVSSQNFKHSKKTNDVLLHEQVILSVAFKLSTKIQIQR